MCAVSAVIGHAMQHFQGINTWPLQPAVDLSEVIKRLDKIDKALGSRDCHEPTKDEFLKTLEARIAELEKQEPIVPKQEG